MGGLLHHSWSSEVGIPLLLGDSANYRNASPGRIGPDVVRDSQRPASVLLSMSIRVPEKPMLGSKLLP